MNDGSNQNTLLASLEALPDPGPSRSSWVGRLKAQQPHLHDEVMQVVDLWNQDSPAVRSKLPRIGDLSGHLCKAINAVGIKVGAGSVAKMVRERNEQGGGA